jgi:hypothetical protein
MMRTTKVKRKIPRPLDFVVIGLSLALTGFAAYMVYGNPGSSLRVVVQGAGDTWVFPIDAEEQVTVPGPLGETVVEISGGRAHVLSSPCANQTCIAAGHINEDGQWVACLPNNVFVLIEGSDNGSGILDTRTW